MKRLRLDQGWRVADLAEKARCSDKTIESVEKGNAVFPMTLQAVAKALSVDYRDLLPDRKAKTTKRRLIQFTLSVSYDDFDASEQLIAFLETLQTLLQTYGEITPMRVDKGSTKLILDMDEADCLRLMSPPLNDRLKELGVTDVQFLPMPQLHHQNQLEVDASFRSIAELGALIIPYKYGLNAPALQSHVDKTATALQQAIMDILDTPLLLALNEELQVALYGHVHWKCFVMQFPEAPPQKVQEFLTGCGYSSHRDGKDWTIPIWKAFATYPQAVYAMKDQKTVEISNFEMVCTLMQGAPSPIASE